MLVVYDDCIVFDMRGVTMVINERVSVTDVVWFCFYTILLKTKRVVYCFE